MSANTTQTASGAETDSRSDANQSVSTSKRRSRDGAGAILLGGAVLVWALKSIRTSKARATLLGLAGLALLGTGMRQRGAERADEQIETGADARRDEEGEKKVSDEAHAGATQDLGAGRNADESQSVSESGTDVNPRGMSDRSDVESDDGGKINFVEGEGDGPHRETHLEDEDAHDPRLHPENDDEPTEIDLSKAAMADEASEAAGPHPEQSYPAFEGTDPEPTSAKAPEQVGEGAVAPAGTEDAADSETDETGAEDDERGTGGDESAKSDD